MYTGFPSNLGESVYWMPDLGDLHQGSPDGSSAYDIQPAVIWGIVKIMVPFWVPIIIRGLIRVLI